MSRSKKIVFALIPAFFVLVMVYAGFLLVRSNRLYRFLKTASYGWEGRVLAYDPVLGFAPVSDSRGFQLAPYAPKIPVRFDKGGFRIQAEGQDSKSRARPLVLALGDSFTFGDGVKGEEAYAFLVGEQLNGHAMNAGVPSYGLAQMLLLAQRLIPEYKPDVVLVQFSEWLVERARNPFAPSYQGRLPVPYFTDSPGRGIVIHPPVFKTKIFDLPVSSYLYTPKSAADYLSFLVRVSLPMYLHDDVNMALYLTKLFSGIVPKPSREDGKILRHVYQNIGELCKANQCQMLIVELHDPNLFDGGITGLFRKELNGQAPVVDPMPALLEKLPEKSTQSYYKTFCRYSEENDFYDIHPNAHAHKIIAELIANAILKKPGGN